MRSAAATSSACSFDLWQTAWPAEGRGSRPPRGRCDGKRQPRRPPRGKNVNGKMQNKIEWSTHQHVSVRCRILPHQPQGIVGIDAVDARAAVLVRRTSSALPRRRAEPAAPTESAEQRQSDRCRGCHAPQNEVSSGFRGTAPGTYRLAEKPANRPLYSVHVLPNRSAGDPGSKPT